MPSSSAKKVSAEIASPEIAPEIAEIGGRWRPMVRVRGRGRARVRARARVRTIRVRAMVIRVRLGLSG